MKILIVAIGRIASKEPEHEMIQEFLKRIPWKVEIKELRSDDSYDKMLGAIPEGYYPIALDKSGHNYSSEGFATLLNDLSNRGASKIAFLIGSATGFDAKFLGKMKSIMSFGKMTHSHRIARIMLVEQIYRAWAILNNHPYHK